MKRWLYKKAVANACWECGKRSNYGIVIWEDGSETAICRECSLQMKFNRKKRNSTQQFSEKQAKLVLGVENAN